MYKIWLQYTILIQELTVIAKVHGSVEPGLAEDDHPRHLVKEDVMVQWQHVHQAHPPHQRDGVPQDEEEHYDGVEVDAEGVGPREHEEIVRLGAVAVVPEPIETRKFSIVSKCE